MLAHLLRALRHSDFRLFYFGQLVSVTGTWMQNLAQAWLVYRLTSSSFMLGLVAFTALLPVLLFGLSGGALADRLSRHRLLRLCQLLALLQALALALLSLSGQVQVWHVLLLSFLLGIVHAIEMPSRLAFVAELVPREDLPNAIALNSGLLNLARFIGPALAGWLVSLTSEGVVFLLNATTFLFVLGVLYIIRVRPHDGKSRPRGHIREGLGYAWGQQRIRFALMLLAAASLVMTSYTVLMPVFARESFGGEADLLGLLLGTAGGGAFAAAVRLAYLGGRQHLEGNIALAASVAGAGMIAFALNERLAVALPLLALLGFSLTTMIASINTLIQVEVDNAMRGRIMALFSVLFVGLTSIGNLLAGSVARFAGVHHTVLLFGGMCLLAGLAYWRRQVLRG